MHSTLVPEDVVVPEPTPRREKGFDAGAGEMLILARLTSGSLAFAGAGTDAPEGAGEDAEAVDEASPPSDLG